MQELKSRELASKISTNAAFGAAASERKPTSNGVAVAFITAIVRSAITCAPVILKRLAAPMEAGCGIPLVELERNVATMIGGHNSRLCMKQGRDNLSLACES